MSQTRQDHAHFGVYLNLTPWEQGVVDDATAAAHAALEQTSDTELKDFESDTDAELNLRGAIARYLKAVRV